MHFKEHAAAIVAYLFNIFQRHQKLQTKALETLLEYTHYCKFQFNNDVVARMHQFLT